MGFNRSADEMLRKGHQVAFGFFAPRVYRRVDEIVVSATGSGGFPAHRILMWMSFKPAWPKRCSFRLRDEVLTLIAERAFGRRGARDIAKVIRKEIEDRITT
jgi:ATP-dependent Clp protease ATP-binding subunit ClpA